MRRLAVITTFPPNRWEAYGKRMLESFIENWPDDVKLYVYYEKELQMQLIKIGRASCRERV